VLKRRGRRRAACGEGEERKGNGERDRVLLVRGEEENPRGGGEGVGSVEPREMREKKKRGREKEGCAWGCANPRESRGKEIGKRKEKGTHVMCVGFQKKIILSSSNKSCADTWQWKIIFYFKTHTFNNYIRTPLY
jgi:hypothetical protein